MPTTISTEPSSARRSSTAAGRGTSCVSGGPRGHVPGADGCAPAAPYRLSPVAPAAHTPADGHGGLAPLDRFQEARPRVGDSRPDTDPVRNQGCAERIGQELVDGRAQGCREYLDVPLLLVAVEE